MDYWDIFILTLAMLATSIVVMRAIHDLRTRTIERVREALMGAANRGEGLLRADRLDMGSCQQWMSESSAIVRRQLTDTAMSCFASKLRDAIVGVELFESRQTPSRDTGVANLADTTTRRSMKSGVDWLRNRARFLGPKDLRGRLWWFGF
jgi:hypothetical protein